MSRDVESANPRWRRVKRKVDEVLLESCFNGLTVKEISEKTKEKENSIYAVLRRGRYPYKINKDGERTYFHLRCKEILDCLQDILLELHEEFVQTEPAVNPSLNRIRTPEYLAHLVLERIKKKNEKVNEKGKTNEDDLTLENVAELINKNITMIEEFINSLGLRVRIGGINYL